LWAFSASGAAAELREEPDNRARGDRAEQHDCVEIHARVQPAEGQDRCGDAREPRGFPGLGICFENGRMQRAPGGDPALVEWSPSTGQPDERDPEKKNHAAQGQNTVAGESCCGQRGRHRCQCCRIGCGLRI
jgi:hypothetical protein